MLEINEEQFEQCERKLSVASGSLMTLIELLKTQMEHASHESSFYYNLSELLGLVVREISSAEGLLTGSATERPTESPRNPELDKESTVTP